MERNHQIELRNVRHCYNNNVVLDIDTLTIEKGKIITIVGPNGSGKTTLLHTMGLVLKPTKGEILFDGKAVEWSEPKLVQIRRLMTVVAQNPFMFNTSVQANIDYGLKIRNITKKERREMVDNVLERFGLLDFKHRNARQLSGGEIQLVAMARGIALNPSVLFLDEITANLDINHVNKLEHSIQRYNKEKNATIIMTTHSIGQAYRIADRVISLFNGKTAKFGMYNLFRGECRKKGREHRFNTGKLSILVPDMHYEKQFCHISINPEDIIISKDRINTPGNNLFPGKIISVIERDNAVHLEVEAEEIFRVQMIVSSFHQMNLTIGTRVFLLFKPISVHVY